MQLTYVTDRQCLGCGVVVHGDDTMEWVEDTGSCLECAVDTIIDEAWLVHPQLWQGSEATS